MNLGEKIYALRVKKNLSQGDIADALDVSRQSVSKWENNNAVPDLDKIIKLAEIFEVSLDELVLGKEGAGNDNKSSAENVGTSWEYTYQTADGTTTAPDQPPASGKKTAGIILLCTAALILLLCTLLGGAGGLLLGLLFAAPFIICGVICFKVKRYVGLWCIWTFYLFADVLLYLLTGIRWSLIRLTLIYEPSMNYGRLVIAWVLFFVTLGLMIYTIRCFVKSPNSVSKKHMFISGGILLGLILLGRLLGPYLLYRWTLVISLLLGWGRMWAMIILLVSVIKYCKRKKEV